ncbi:MAG: DUF1080 domain-containing protein [Saprospiraceae bacterium]|nr:DUF1080 domain-containing protein [Saprospiraceae bacterium]
MRVSKMIVVLLIYAIGALPKVFAQQDQAAIKVFQAGAATTNITPPIGTGMNGHLQDRTIVNIHDDTHVRSLVLDDGKTTLAFAVMDLCMVYREIVDSAKHRAHRHTGIPIENIMISATHTHTAGTACHVFQSDPDEAYQSFLARGAADAIIRAYRNLQPADIGWGAGSEPDQVFNRRWHLQAGTDIPNPFGTKDKVKMNPPRGHESLVKPAGPIDPEISFISLQTKKGEPLALLANYSLHYVGGVESGSVSADYFGLFASRMGELLGTSNVQSPFVGMMTNGTSGDINNIDFTNPAIRPREPYEKMKEVAYAVAAEVHRAMQTIDYVDWVPLKAVQKEIRLGVRHPNQDEILRAENIVKHAEGPNMKSLPEIYARETLLIQAYPKEVDLVLQSFRIGDLAVAAIPCEVFVEIGLELKKESPFGKTFTVSLANGYNGYLPTPEHHALGGYETWRARSSYLKTNASVEIVENMRDLFDELQQRPITSQYREAPDTDKLNMGETHKLFNGQNLEGWYTWLKDRGRNLDPKGVFSIEDEELKISGEEWGCITTENAYENYILTVEYRWGEKTYTPREDRARDGGILVHSQGKDGSYSGTWMNSIECQIIEGGTGDFIVVGDGLDRFSITSPVLKEKQGSSSVYSPAGSPTTITTGRINWFGRDPAWEDKLGFRGDRDVVNPTGMWNAIECHIYKDEITVYVNGKLVNRAFNVKPTNGQIQIQSEGAEMFIRKIDLTPILD